MYVERMKCKCGRVFSDSESGTVQMFAATRYEPAEYEHACPDCGAYDDGYVHPITVIDVLVCDFCGAVEVENDGDYCELCESQNLVECPYCKEIELPGRGGQCRNCQRETFFSG